MATTRTKTAELPEADTALIELTRRQTRAIVSLLLRVVGVGILIAVLVTQVPGLARHRGFLDAGGFVLILWPFITMQGKIVSWRIALGQKYAAANRWADAERTLAPLGGRYARFFDAKGDGLRLLNESRAALHRSNP